MQKGSYVTLCKCRLTLAWVTSENSTKLLECRFIFRHCGWTLSHADSPLCSGVRCRLPLSVVPRQLPSSSFVQPTPFSRPHTNSGHGKISSPKPFVWFRAKTDKGIVCLAGHLHSVTFGIPTIKFAKKTCFVSLHQTLCWPVFFTFNMSANLQAFDFTQIRLKYRKTIIKHY